MLDAGKIFEDLAGYAARLAPMITDTNDLLHTALADGKKILCEGANAVMLDVDHGTYPYVTSSNCSSLGIYPGTSLPGGTIKNIVGIVKLYTSRVGEGPFPTELFGDEADKIRVAGNEFGATLHGSAVRRPLPVPGLPCLPVLKN
jgi:adenylosuccinate synthase